MEPRKTRSSSGATTPGSAKSGSPEPSPQKTRGKAKEGKGAADGKAAAIPAAKQKKQATKADVPGKTTLPKMELPSQNSAGAGSKRQRDFTAEGGPDSKRNSMELLTNAAEAACASYPMHMAISPALHAMTAPYPPTGGFHIPTSNAMSWGDPSARDLPSVPSFLSGITRDSAGHGGVDHQHGGVMAMAAAAAAAQAAAVAQPPGVDQAPSLALI